MELEGRAPNSLIACIGGGSNAMGLFHPFLDDKDVEIYGVEAAGHGLDSGMHAASIAGGKPGVLHGNRTYLLMDADGQINEAHSISAGLDYPGIGPEHAWLGDMGRITFLSATDDEALSAFQLCCKLEGIIPALEPAHALARRDRARAAEAEGSPDGGEYVRPRRQGPGIGREASRGQGVISRQKIVGWVLVIASAAYLAYFWRIKLMTPGPLLTGRDWFNLITSHRLSDHRHRQCAACGDAGPPARSARMTAAPQLP